MSNPRRTGLAALSALTFAASTPAHADVLDTSAMTCGNPISGLSKNISGVVTNVGDVMGYLPKEATGGSRDLLMTRNAFYASASGSPAVSDNIMSDLVSQASTDGVNLMGVATALCDHDVVHDKTLLADMVGGQAVLVQGLEGYLNGSSTDLTVSAISGTASGCASIDNDTGQVFVITRSSATGHQTVIQEWTSAGLSTASNVSFDIEYAVIDGGDALVMDASSSSSPWKQGVLGTGSYSSFSGASGIILGHSSSYESTTGQDFVFYPGTSGIEYCEVSPVEAPLAPELTALDDNLAMPISAGVSIPHDINAGDISLTAICVDSDATSPSELAIEIDANWETGEPAYMTSRGTTSPASTAISIQEGFEMTPYQLGEVSLAVECMDGDGLVDEIRNASYVVSAPTASGELVYGSYYDFEESLLRAEADGASATGSEVTLVPEDGDMLTMDDLRDALVSFVVEDGGTIEFNTAGTSLDAQVTVFGISAGAAPEGQPAPPNAGSFEVNVSVQVESGGTATMKFTDVDGTVLYDGPVEGELDFSNIEGGDDGSDTGSDSGSGTETGSGSGSEGGETDGGDDGLDGGSGEGAGGGTEQPQGNGGCAVAPGTPASAVALLAALIAMARRRRQG